MKTFYKNYYLRKSKYYNNDSIYLELGNDEETYSAITINFDAFRNVYQEDDIIALDNDLKYDNVDKKLEELGLYTIIGEIPCGFSTYEIAKLNMLKVKEYAIEMR